ncbi:AAA family ATPase [Pseudothauera rhizosphaerae]|uniref:AAA family ATPase n=1 Tax=Pseudothauera rhizosphaerae TaxID=2565932 RepID=A0A4S4AW10_9RHOO|nr:AAA family ATPase [Pseudothauera rhizosphaerae]THF64214.1 AAA family ATPase [Pseudothauera rhizosphaerae]
MPYRHVTRLLEAASQIILGKEHELRLALTCAIARGHLLIEDVPGVGKTTLAHVMARLIGLQFQRIQFTSDLLPADIIGVSVFDRDSSTFRFHPGPVFAQLILADEVNRATPKTQSALLEAMEEHQVTADGQTLPLPEPFFVIATQNPVDQIGTFPLPESQLDRFLMRIRLGYPDRAAERALLMGEDRRSVLERREPVIGPQDLLDLQRTARGLTVTDRLIDYVHALVVSTRRNGELTAGLSPRAGLGLLSAARAWALVDGRDHVLPEDVQAVFPHVAGHRLHLAADGRPAPAETLHRMIEAVALN